MNRKQKLFLILVLTIAFFFRFYLINQMPGGLFPDEAANGLDINLMQQGQYQPFYERGNGREALFFYFQWASIALFGKGAWQHHIVSALVGFFAVWVCFLVARQLFMVGVKKEDPEYFTKKNRSVNLGLLAAFLMATSSWHVVLSRTAFRANLIPLFVGLTIYFLLKAYLAENKKNFYFHSAAFGAFFALGFYTYIAYRILAPILAVAIFWPMVRNGFYSQIKHYWKAASLAVLSFCLFIYPLFHYFYTHPGSFVGRSGQVSVFNPELNQGNLPGAIGTVFIESLKAYFSNGDLNWRHNISGWPFLSQLISPFFAFALLASTLLACLYIFKAKSRPDLWKHFLLSGLFWGMLLPVITTAEGIPHGLRSIGTIPAVFILTAWGIFSFKDLALKTHRKLWDRCGQFLQNYPGQKLVSYSFKILAVLFFTSLVSQTYLGYFVYAYNSPENFYSFRSDLTPVSEYLLRRCRKDQTYLVLDKFSVQTTDYTTSDPEGDFSSPCNVPYKQVDPEDSWKLSNLKIGDEIIFTQSSIFDIKKFKQYHPKARLKTEIRNKFGQAVMAAYVVE